MLCAASLALLQAVAVSQSLNTTSAQQTYVYEGNEDCSCQVNGQCADPSTCQYVFGGFAIVFVLLVICSGMGHRTAQREAEKHGVTTFDYVRTQSRRLVGFGGGDEISHNLVFSTCRESGDVRTPRH